jgi:hypothetical protein
VTDEVGTVKKNVPVKHRGVLARIEWRNLFLKVQGCSTQNKADMGRLQAAAMELEDVSGMVEKKGGRFSPKPAIDIDEMIELEVSDLALKGIRVAVVRFLKPEDPKFNPVYAERKGVLDACEGFGSKFRKMVEAEAKLAESDELDEEEPLDLSEEKK